eukprot:Gb_34890 [translate_table: standard]
MVEEGNIKINIRRHQSVTLSRHLPNTHLPKLMAHGRKRMLALNKSILHLQGSARGWRWHGRRSCANASLANAPTLRTPPSLVLESPADRQNRRSRQLVMAGDQSNHRLRQLVGRGSGLPNVLVYTTPADRQRRRKEEVSEGVERLSQALSL